MIGMHRLEGANLTGDRLKVHSQVVLDACVLAEAALSDLFLRLAEESNLVSPRCTDEIWEEVRRTCIEKLGWPEKLIDSRIAAAKQAFPEAIVVGYEHLIPLCTNHPDDRHVLAAAIHSQASLIVTFNVADFGPEHMASWEIDAVHPSDYLRGLFERDSEAVVAVLNTMARKANRSLGEMLGRIAWHARPFAAHVAQHLSIEVSDVTPTSWRR